MIKSKQKTLYSGLFGFLAGSILINLCWFFLYAIPWEKRLIEAGVAHYEQVDDGSTTKFVVDAEEAKKILDKE